MRITNYGGHRVWLREAFNAGGKRIGIEDCCHKDEPCDWHRSVALMGRRRRLLGTLLGIAIFSACLAIVWLVQVALYWLSDHIGPHLAFGGMGLMAAAWWGWTRPHAEVEMTHPRVGQMRPHNEDPAGRIRHRGRLSWGNEVIPGKYAKDRVEQQRKLAKSLQGPGGRFVKRSRDAVQTPRD